MVVVVVVKVMVMDIVIVMVIKILMATVGGVDSSVDYLTLTYCISTQYRGGKYYA